jgi:hypothetical protein
MEQVLVVLAGVVPVSVAWGLNEWSKRRETARARREERYFELVSDLAAFYDSSSPDLAGRDRFVREARLAWLYCPDNVVRALNEFLQAVQGRDGGPVERSRAARQLVLRIRKELLGRTSLTEKEVEFWSVAAGDPRSPSVR